MRALPIGTTQSALGHRPGGAVEDLVLQHEHGVGIADRRLEQALRIGRVRRRHYLQSRHVGIPRRIALAVLGADARRRAVGTAEHDRAAHLAARHVERLGGGVDDLVDRLHGEIPGHELDDRLETGHGRADTDAGKALLGDGRIDHAPFAELLEQALADLVGALVLRHLLAHQQDVLVTPHLLGHGVPQRLAHRLIDGLGARRHFRLRDAGSRASLTPAGLKKPPEK